jgi:threonine dehydrogenase-like Zn-dependent dehydrogenase
MPLAAVLHAAHTLRLAERPSRELAAHEARVRVARAGICGTDLAIWSGRYPVPLPLVLGHEWCGTVAAVGRAADQGWVGRRVVAEINNHCRACERTPVCSLCERGLVTHCLARTTTGIIRHDGAFQEEIVVPTGNLRALPDDLGFVEAAFIEPLAAALQTFALTPIERGALVVVLGAGRLGVLIALVAQRLGAEVLSLTRTARRRDLLERLGVPSVSFDASTRAEPRDPLAPASSPILQHVLEVSAGRGADIVVEATGNEHAFGLAQDLVAPRGTICLKSTPGHGMATLRATRLVVNEVGVQGSRCGDFTRAIDFQRRERLPLADLVEHTFPLADIERALTTASHAGKVVLAIGS